MAFIVLELIIIEIIIINFLKIDTNIKKIGFIYGFEISVLLLISMLNPLGMDNVSVYTYILIILMVISFIVPLFILSKKIIKNTQNEEEISTSLSYYLDKLLNSKIFLCLIILNLLLVTFYKIKYNIIIEEVSKQEVRMVRFNNLFNSSFETLFFNYIITGTIYILSNLFAILLINKKFKNIQFIIITLNIIIYSLIGYGRMTYLNIIIYCFNIFLLKGNLKKALTKKNLFKFASICVSIFFVFTAFIYFRTESDKLSLVENIKKSIYDQGEQLIQYSVGGFRLLDDFIKEGFGKFPKFTLGEATFAGAQEIILYPIKGLGFEISSFNNRITEYTQTSIVIGEKSLYFNAFYTSIMNYYLDFGVIGVIMYPILHSILIIYGLKNYYLRKDVFSLLLLNYLLMNLFFSIIRWNYQSGTSVFVLMFLIFLNIISNKYMKRNLNKNESIVDSK